MSKQQIYLIPGFFGFTTLGALNYFQGVRQELERHLNVLGVDCVIHETETLPTGSIRQRALRLLHLVEETGGLESDGLHFVGHSTGGLDARLLATPGVQLVSTDLEERVGRLIRTVQTLSTPHFGTPLANFFTTLQGRNVLYALTLFATTRPGRWSLAAMAQYLTLVSRLDDLVGQTDTLLDQVSERLLASISIDRGHRLWDFVHEISQDQGAVIQLTPESVDLFNAAVWDRPDVRYVSHVSAAPPPLSRTSWRDLRSLYDPLAMGLYSLVYSITAKEHRSYPYPSPKGVQRQELDDRLPFPVDASTNDGIVPSLSQVWGEIGEVVEGDHLDVVGQYHRQWNGRQRAAWLKSGASFGDAQMTRLWGAIAKTIEETA